MKIIYLLLFSLSISAQTLLTETFSDFAPDSTQDSLKLTYYFKTYSATLDTHDYTGTYELTARTGGVGDSVINNSPLVDENNSVYLDGTDDQYEILNGNNGIQLSASPFTWSVVIFLDDYTGQIFSKGDDYQLRASNATNSAKGLFLRLDDGPDFYTQAITSSTVLNYGSWNQITMLRATDSVYVFVDGVGVNMPSTTGTYANVGAASTAVDFEVGSIVNVQEFQGYLACLQYWSDSLSIGRIKANVFLAKGWAAIDSAEVIRNNFAFHQGVITDTVYYNTILAPGSWRVQVDVDGNSGGETYRILTSADKSSWSDLGSGTAGASPSTVTVTGTGLGYIGLAVSSAADSVFFDNLTVSLVAGGDPGFDGYVKSNKFLGFK